LFVVITEIHNVLILVDHEVKVKGLQCL